ncbi:16S rRNA (guanine(966)-N(2))-methyltransferase RsmD [Ramlibacter sp. RBP-2]|uniref:16S rRNA (Guanine(966)-N(2))-methyltransferase RsmD n=1 Tax=Ramlibacter lithotrophicus TaxID=2606681 RepID=A0A7X6DI88_9BURK|nr:16S rRNA (guanine(966)-N(2))-methyltransferase RsmD [Ramlibacter lithotrophicus]NKE67662.1 16S rRNA (guanine(966)-N(2))-methyltransferase RsmD [Ramlibacter lithotrophicus]
MARGANPARPARPPRGPLPREVRIIGGQWKRTKLPVADKPGLRPTPDRVRETLFNWLDHDLAGWRCVDAFAGTGALGFEAASRGAAEVLMVEQDPELVAQLRTVQKRLDAQSVKVERGNGLSVLTRLAPGSVDLVFLDPPFDAAIFDKALAAAATLLAPGDLAYLESPTAWGEPALAGHGFALLRHLRAGAVHAHLLQRTA